MCQVESGRGEKKKEFGYVSKKSKKYLCEGVRQKQPVMGSCQVQPMVTENVDTGNQTTVYKEKENDISGLEGTSIVILDWAMLLWYERESVRALYIDYEIRSVA